MAILSLLLIWIYQIYWIKIKAIHRKVEIDSDVIRQESEIVDTRQKKFLQREDFCRLVQPQMTSVNATNTIT